MNTEAVLKTLKRAKEIIALPEHWTKGCSARDANNEECDQGATDTHASKWCMFGAVELSAMELDTDSGNNITECADLLIKAQRYAWNNPYNIKYWTVTDFNDAADRTHAEALKCFQVAIEHLEVAQIQ
jgi:hypothetical protein